jgi:hypothetical protein
MKRKQPFSLSDFIHAHGGQKRKKTKKQIRVRISEFSTTANNPNQQILRRVAVQVVFNHLMIALGLFGKHGKRCRQDVF